MCSRVRVTPDNNRRAHLALLHQQLMPQRERERERERENRVEESKRKMLKMACNLLVVFSSPASLVLFSFLLGHVRLFLLKNTDIAVSIFEMFFSRLQNN